MPNFFDYLNQYPKIKRLFIILLSVSFLLIIIPFIIQWTIIYGIKDQGANSASIEDIDLNIFKGTFKLEQLKAQFKESSPISIDLVSVDLAMSDLFDSKIVLEKIEVNAIDLNIHKMDDGNISINGYLLPITKNESSTKPTTDSKPLDFSIQAFNLNNSNINYQETDFEQNIQIHNINLNNLTSWLADTPAQLEFTISENKTEINGKLDLVIFNKERKVQGNVSVKNLGTDRYKKFHQDHLNSLNASINLNTNLDLNISDSINGVIEHQLSISQLALNYKQLEATTDEISWKGLALLKDNQASVKGDLSIKNSKLTDLDSKVLLNQFHSLDIDTVQYEGQTASFEKLLLTQLVLLENSKKVDLVKLESLSLNQFTFDLEQSNLKLNKVDIKNPVINATISKQKQLTHLALLNPVLDRLSSQEPIQAPEVEKTEPPSKKTIIEVNEIILSKPGKLTFNDQSVSPIYATDFHFKKIDIKKLSSENPASFNLKIVQGEYTQFDIAGKGLMFAPKQNMELTTEITQLDLPPVSSYTGNSTGYAIKSGVVDSTIKVNIDKYMLDSNIKLKIDSIEVTEVNKESAEQLSSASGMSIGLALDTLKDSDNIIDLEMPIKGDINDPDFDLSLVTNKALGIAMQSATLGYLKYTLQPFGSLITLYSVAKYAANHISLAPVEFNANSTKINKDQIALLDKVNTVLNERPNIKIKSCGISSLEDQSLIKQQLTEQQKIKIIADAKVKKLKPPVLAAQIKAIKISDKKVHQLMKDLADQRSATIKAYFINQKGVKSSRILNCLSQENLEKESKPMVELAI